MKDNLIEKIFVFDLDGTIAINSKIENSIIVKLNQLMKNGHMVLFATSRSIRGAKAVLPKEFINNILLLCNGAFVLEKNQIVLSNYIEQKTCINLCSFLEKYQIQYYLELGNAVYVPSYVEHPFISVLKDEGKDENIYTELFNISNKAYKISLLEPISDVVQDKLDKLCSRIQYFVHSDNTVDIVANNCSKWKMLKRFLKSKNITDYKIIAFGNDSNDIELIKNANIGISVKSNNDTLVKLADINIVDYKSESIINAINEAMKI
ncbi:HAD-IIB family hydrolase [[Clostridium] polysaccharolyticum]|uniref:Haloacid dehalogenase-like hydrolase n=1 Tax=[Clostridium] polysaccharolyticum TaxID=29364 RepID=A0A1H9ZBG4_9FIRM|nr:HAD-IIB family hydrolase [[Clostridium] polysaccharolyticum]SES78400.1 haloacid dehalogenase-like hydrolase [[Clostridium] polysaccharolyticum]